MAGWDWLSLSCSHLNWAFELARPETVCKFGFKLFTFFHFTCSVSEVGSITSITGDSHLTSFDGPGDELKTRVFAKFSISFVIIPVCGAGLSLTAQI